MESDSRTTNIDENETDKILDNLADILFDKWMEETDLGTSGNINSDEK